MAQAFCCSTLHTHTLEKEIEKKGGPQTGDATVAADTHDPLSYFPFPHHFSSRIPFYICTCCNHCFYNESHLFHYTPPLGTCILLFECSSYKSCCCGTANGREKKIHWRQCNPLLTGKVNKSRRYKREK